jgi:serralysin
MLEEATGMPKKPVVPIVGKDDANDDLTGTNRGETMRGLGGDDSLSGKNGDDLLYGDAGNVLPAGDDVLNGGNGKDYLYGGAENDNLNGGNGKDSLYGEEGDDVLNGGHGKDLLDGGEGADQLYGDKGKDTFQFGLLFGDDTIWDFKDGKEKIDLTAFAAPFGFGSLDIDLAGNDALITVAGHGTILVKNAADLIDESDFIFAA